MVYDSIYMKYPEKESLGTESRNYFLGQEMESGKERERIIALTWYSGPLW